MSELEHDVIQAAGLMVDAIRERHMRELRSKAGRRSGLAPDDWVLLTDVTEKRLIMAVQRLRGEPCPVQDLIDRDSLPEMEGGKW